MPQNGINHPGVTALAMAMQHNPNLRTLNLNDNTFTDKGAIAMAEVRQRSELDSLLHEHGEPSLELPRCPPTSCPPPRIIVLSCFLPLLV